MKSIRLLLTCSIVCTALGVTGCGANIFTTKQEISMGQEFAREIDGQTVLLDDPAWTAYINDIGQNIVRICDRRDISYVFKIVDDDSTVNAFAVPGGFIYVYSGLLMHAGNEAELAGVLAHEVGHVVARHSMKKLTKIYGFQFAMALALGENPNQLVKICSDILAGGLILDYGRDNEFEADRYSAKYLASLGYDPGAFVSFLEKLASMQSSTDEAGFLQKLMATHPPPADRIAEVRRYIDTLPPLDNPALNTEKYRQMRRRLVK